LTIALVALVILLFLGTFRATLIPVVCIPISLFGALIALQALGYSINLITLLAMVLAIGLVVDDAIVVLENIYRRIEDGEAPLLAAARGAQQVGFAVIATTAVLLAVFSPVLFLQDATAKLFVELAVTIASGVVVSSVMALSLVPMMCSQLLSATKRPSALTTLMNSVMSTIRHAYEVSLRWLLPRSWLALPLIIGAIAAIAPVTNLLEREYVPVEDQDAVMARVMAPEGTNMTSMRSIIETLQPAVLKRHDEGTLTRVLFVSPFFNATAPTEAFLRISTVPQDQRDYSTFELRNEILAAWQGIPGILVMVYLPAGLGQRGPNTPVQFVLQGPDYEQLAQWRDLVMARAQETGLFGMLTSDLKETQQQIHVAIDATRAAALEVTTREVAEALQVLMTEQEVTTFSADGEEYPVIVQLEDYQRMTPADIENVQVRGINGQLVPLSNLLTTDSRAGIADLNRYNRLRAVTISGSPAEGVSLGEALEALETIVARELPAVAKVAYKGQSEDYKESGNDITFALGLALLVLFLVMAAQFESFVHPAVIMVTVPLALLGGLIGLLVTGETFNLFSQIGLLMLIGIATKNGILLVEFINQVRDEGVPFDDAIVQASGLRLRPVLMTTLSTLIGAVPLVLMTGPGSASRNVLGVVVLFGVSLATLFTLYLVPAVYRLIARHTSSPETIAREMQRLENGAE
jgi:multidrug efflux pump